MKKKNLILGHRQVFSKVNFYWLSFTPYSQSRSFKKRCKLKLIISRIFNEQMQLTRVLEDMLPYILVPMGNITCLIPFPLAKNHK